MNNDVSRRRFFANACKVTAGAAFGAGLASTLSTRADVEGHSEDLFAWPWPYARLDPDRVRDQAYAAFQHGHCAYGAMEGIIAELREEVGVPFTMLPSQILEYGKGGGVGWGTLCGALNGAPAAISLVTADSDMIINELIGWYTKTELPIYEPTAESEAQVEAQSVAGSPLCHASVTEWCNASGHGVNSAERKERCARLTADVAGRAVELLNAFVAGELEASWTAPASAGECLSCHGPDGSVDNAKGKMDCLGCHDRH